MSFITIPTRNTININDTTVLRANAMPEFMHKGVVRSENFMHDFL